MTRHAVMSKHNILRRLMRRDRGWTWMAVAMGAMVLTGCVSNPQQGGRPYNAALDAAGAPVATGSSTQTNARNAAVARVRLAASYFADGKVDVAFEEAQKAANVDPSYADTHDLLGLIYMHLGDMQIAESEFRQALSLAPNNPNTQHNYGWMLCKTGRFAQADAYFDKALQDLLYAGKAKTQMAKGLCYKAAGNVVGAEQALVAANALDPENPIVGYNLAEILFEQGNYERARFYIRRINNSQFANAETLWLGVKIENQLQDAVSMHQLGEQLQKRFPEAPQALSYARRAFNE